MRNFYYTFQLEYNGKNHMILKIIKRIYMPDFVDIYEKGFMIIEDTRRKAILDDFDYLKEAYLDLNEEWDSSDNFIKISICTYEVLNEDEKDLLCEIASTFIEFKPCIDYRIDFFVDEKLVKIDCDNKNCIKKTLQYILNNYTENKINIKNISESDLNYLNQSK